MGSFAAFQHFSCRYRIFSAGDPQWSSHVSVMGAGGGGRGGGGSLNKALFEAYYNVVGIYRGSRIIPGFLEWCEMGFVRTWVLQGKKDNPAMYHDLRRRFFPGRFCGLQHFSATGIDFAAPCPNSRGRCIPSEPRWHPEGPLRNLIFQERFLCLLFVGGEPPKLGG